MKKRITVLLLLVLVLCGCTAVQPQQPSVSDPVQTDSIVTGPDSSIPPSDSTDGLTVHYIDVGQADCTLLECGGKFMLIDGGNNADSSLVVSYLLSRGVEELEAVVGTHGHEDHIGGLAGVLAVFPTHNVYCATRVYNSRAFDNFIKYADQQRQPIQIPPVGLQFPLGDATVTVLGPIRKYASTNNTSLVLRVEYGDTRFLFTGDMEYDAEQDLLNEGTDLKADVLKVGHHGSHTSTGYRFLYEVNPKYAVIQCGKGNAYGHPHEEVTSRLDDADVMTYRNDELGNIVAHSDGRDITFSWSRKNAKPGISNTPEFYDFYIGDTRRHVLHRPNCRRLPDQFNRIIFDTLEEAEKASYHHCPYCMD